MPNTTTLSNEMATAKLDAPLWNMYQSGDLDSNQPLAVILRCDREAIPAVSALVMRAGGSVRHVLAMLGGVSAWVAGGTVLQLAADDAITRVSLAEELTVA